MRIVFIYPTNKRLFQQPSLGVMYLAAIARNKGWSTKIIEGTKEEIQAQLSQLDHVDVIGITCMTPFYREILEIAKYCKENFSGTSIIAGGPHATIMPTSLLKSFDVDGAVIGEGEDTLRDFLDCQDFGVKGMATYDSESDGLFYDKREEPVNLDMLPFPARDMINQEYFAHGRCSIMASRGCPYNCTFCQPTLRKIFGSKVRWRTPFNVAREMKHCIDNYKIKTFEFFDDTFTANEKWIYKFCEDVSGMHINTKFEILTRVNAVNIDMLKRLKEIGLQKISFGVESGSQKILDEYGKGITVPQVEEAFKLCKESGIKTHGLFMIGSIGETKETVNETKSLIKRIKPDSIFMSITTPLPHTELYDRCVRENRLSGDVTQNVNYYNTPMMVIDGLTFEQIKKLRQNILTEFTFKKMLNPVNSINYVKEHGIKNSLKLSSNVFRGN